MRHLSRPELNMMQSRATAGDVASQNRGARVARFAAAAAGALLLLLAVTL